MKKIILVIPLLIAIQFIFSTKILSKKEIKNESLIKNEIDYNLIGDNYYCSWDNCNYGGNMNLNRVVLGSGKIVRPFSMKGDNILCVTSALVADNAESSSYGWLGHSPEAILSIKIYYSLNSFNWNYLYSIPLPGKHYTGDEGAGPYKGYPKMEWLDCECMDYQNFGIVDWDLFRYKYIRFQIEEGDKFVGNNILLDVWYESSYLIWSQSATRISASNYHHAAIWVKTVDYNY